MSDSEESGKKRRGPNVYNKFVTQNKHLVKHLAGEERTTKLSQLWRESDEYKLHNESKVAAKQARALKPKNVYQLYVSQHFDEFKHLKSKEAVKAISEKWKASDEKKQHDLSKKAKLKNKTAKLGLLASLTDDDQKQKVAEQD